MVRSRAKSALSLVQMKEELLRKLEVLSPHLPTNTLDELIDGLGGPDRVSEMTGRRGRIVSLSDGSVQYQLRSEADVPLEMLNIAEKQRFMDGDKVHTCVCVCVHGDKVHNVCVRVCMVIRCIMCVCVCAW